MGVGGKEEVVGMIRKSVIGIILGLMIATVAAAAGGEDRPRVLILGFDGMDPNVADLMMREGRLPNLERLPPGNQHTATEPGGMVQFHNRQEPGWSRHLRFHCEDA